MVDAIQFQCRNSSYSCLDIARNQKTPLTNQYYLIYDRSTCNHSKPSYFVVYCDFTSQPGYAWTLIESFSRNNRRHSSIDRGFAHSTSANSYNPRNNWSLYRMSRDHIFFVYDRYRSLSPRPLWRATCNFLSLSRPFSSLPRDVMYSSFDSFNILSIPNIGTCITLDYLNIRGYVSTSRSFYFYSGGTNYHFYLYAYQTRRRCDYYNIPGSNTYDNYFGHYSTYHSEFSCSRSGSSTTNWWIGSKIHQ